MVTGFEPALIILRVKEDRHTIVKFGYVELEFDVKFNEKGNDAFLSKSTSNIEVAALASIPEHSLRTDARAPVHRQGARNNDAVVENAHGLVGRRLLSLSA
jgi:hypothetical protein